MISASLDPVTNRETVKIDVELYDEEAGEYIDISDVTEIVVEAIPRNGDRCTPALTAKLSTGDITEIQTGIVQVVFTVDEMKSLCAGTYDIGGTLTKDDEVVQFLLGQLPVQGGIVSR